MSREALVFEEFEPRILYSADLAPLVLAGMADQQVDAQWQSVSDTAHREIAFVDLGLADAQTLIDDLRAQAQAGRDIEVVTIAADEDGIAVVSATLAQRSDIAAVHLLSEGSDGVVHLGSSQLDAATLLRRAGELAQWSAAFTGDADLLIYGCNVAERDDGLALVNSLAALTGADVAASTDLTGAARLGGNWTLEQRSGSIEAGTAISAAGQQQVQATLSLLARDTFSSSGNLDGKGGGTGWATNWSGGGNKMQVTGSGLNDPTGTLVTSGGSVRLQNTLLLDTVAVTRDMSVTVGAAGTTTWISFLVEPDGLALNDYMGLKFGSASATVAFAGYSAGNFVIGLAGNTGNTAVPGASAQMGQPVLLVLKIEHNAGNDSITLYVNPLPGLAAPNSAPGATLTVTNIDLGSFTQIAIACGSALGTNTSQLDEIRIGQTFADVAPSSTANAPVITSNGGGATAAVNVAENSTAVTTVTATDIDAGSSLAYTISGGADAAKFAIHATTGALSFLAAPDFEAPADVGANNVYDVVVQVSDGSLVDTQALAVAVIDVSDWVQISAAQDTYINSGSTTNFGTSTSLVVDRSGGNQGDSRALLQFDLSTIPAGATITGASLQMQATANASPFMIDVYRLTEAWVEGSGGTSAANWNDRLPGTPWTNINGASIDPTPAATWASLPAAGAGTHRWDLTTLVRGWQTGSSANHGILLGSTATGTTTVTYSSSEGATPPRLVVTYVLNAAPVVATSGSPLATTENDAARQIDPGLTVSDADDTALTGASIAISANYANGQDILAFTNQLGINGSWNAGSGVLTLTGTTTLANYQTALRSITYANSSNDPSSLDRTIAFVVSDGTGNSVAATRTVSVLAVNDAPTITSNGGGTTAAVNVAESGTAVTTVTATDPEAGTTLTYTVSGGADAAKFTINATTGALAFVTAPNFEVPGDVGADNVYEVTVQVSDGTLTDTQAIRVAVTNTNEAPNAVSDAYSVNQDQTLTVPVATGLLANDSDPEGSTLTITAVLPPSHGTLSLIPAMLGAFTNLSNNAATDTRGDWSPDRTQIAFDSNRDGNNEIYVMNADGSGVTRLTNHPGDDSQAAWSPDGSRIAFMSNRDGNYEVWAMNADGTGLLQLTNTASATSGQPSWSPDGSKIAFTSNRSGGNFEIFVMNADGSNVARLTTASGDDTEPVWSPDGSRIAFASTRDGNSEIYLMNADGSDQTRLTTDGGVDRSPVWSPYGSKIAFISDRSGTAQIVVMDPDGANATAVTAQASGVGFVDWSSNGRRLLFTVDNEIQIATFAASGAFVYTPTAGYSGSDGFIYTVADPSGLGDVTSVAITVTPSTAPTITSNGAGSTAAVSVAENTRTVTTVTATDTDLPTQTLSYAITGGADAAKFSIDAATGALAFLAAPDFETPGDVGGNNVYDVVVQVSDGALTDLQTIAVSVTNLGEALQTTVEQRVNTTTAAAQATVLEDRGSTAAVAVAASGDYVVVWSSQNQDGSGWGVYGQRFDRTGAAVGGEFLVNQTTAGDQVWATVAIDDAGRFVVSWTGVDGDGTQSIYARTYAANGSASSAEFRANTTMGGDQHNGAVAMDASGNFIVVWEGNGTGDSDGIFGRRFTVTGVAIDASEFRINTDLARAHYDPAVSMNASGAFAVVWDDQVGAQVRRFDSSGAALGAEVTVAASITAGDAAVALAADGSLVVVWRETVGGDRNVYLRRYDSTGVALTAAVQVSTTTAADQFSPSITMDGAGNFIIAWEGNGAGDTSGVFARKYDTTGSALGAEFLLNSTTTGAQTMASVAMLGPNDFVAAWTGEGPGDSSGVFSRQFGTINVAPVITSDGGSANATLSRAENTLAVTTLTATDLDSWQTLTYAITGGADAAKFSINATTGVLSFVAAPNFEVPTDVGTNNIYDVVVQVSDGSLTDSQAIAVTVSNANEAPVITSSGSGATASTSVVENQSGVVTVAASDVDAATTLIYTVSGADAAKFSINAATGVLSFVAAPDFEAPTDVGTNNIYDVVVQVSDGTLTDSQAIAVTVSNANEAPVITSSGSGATASTSVVENQSGVVTVAASDVDAATTLIYTVSGADAAKFSINAATGVLSFVAAPDFEAPTDVGANNVYNVVVQVSDGTLTDSQAIAVTVSNVNEAPVVTSSGAGATAAVNVTENQSAVVTVAATDVDAATTLSYTVSGADAAKFSINAATGVLSFVAAPDFEAPTDAGANNVYDVIVQVSDGTLTDSQAIAVTVSNVNEAPVITSGGGGSTASLSVAENQSGVVTIAATDVDAATALSYTVSGADAAKFSINAATGVLSFIAAPDFEAPTDAGANNVYNVVVQVSDGTLTDSQAIAVSVTNAGEAPVIVSNSLVITEGGSATPSIAGSDVDTLPAQLVYSVSALTGGQFETVGAAGVAIVSFTQADLDAGRIRFVHDGGEAAPAWQLSLSDGTLATQAQAATVSFTPLNDAPAVLAVELGSIAEDGSRLITAAELLAGATDAEGETLSVANLTLVSGQASLVDQGNGRWLLTPLPNWNGSVVLRFDVSDGTATLSNSAGLAVLPVADAPRITSQGGGDAAVLAVAENTAALTTVTASPGDGTAPLRFSISGGADAAAFAIDAATGVLRFFAAPDRERPADTGGDNRYEVTVRVSEGALFDEQAIAVDVGNVDEAPTLLRNELQINNGAATVVLLATDPDTPDTALVYQVSGEVGGRFELVAAPGVAIAGFTQADVNAGNVRFVVDGSALAPSYSVQLSDGVTTSAPALPTLVDRTPASAPAAANEEALLPAAELAAPATAPARSGPAPATAAAAPTAPPATTTAAPRAPVVPISDAFAGSESAGLAFERAAARSNLGAIAGGELRATVRDIGADGINLGSLQVDLIDWAQADANAGSDAGSDTPRQDLAAALRERSLSQALDGLRRGVDEAHDGVEQLVVGSTTLSAGLSVGYVLWLARGGVLMASVLSALPAWASLDPLPVLGQVNGKGKAGMVGAAGDDEDEDDDAVENLFDKRRTAGTAPAATAAMPQEAP